MFDVATLECSRSKVTFNHRKRSKWCQISKHGRLLTSASHEFHNFFFFFFFYKWTCQIRKQPTFFPCKSLFLYCSGKRIRLDKWGFCLDLDGKTSLLGVQHCCLTTRRSWVWLLAPLCAVCLSSPDSGCLKLRDEFFIFYFKRAAAAPESNTGSMVKELHHIFLHIGPQ